MDLLSWHKSVPHDKFITNTEHSEHYTNLSTLNHNVRFLPCQHRALA